jgi:hypothetical protein
MRLKHLIRPFALTTAAAMLAMAVALVWGAGVGLARGTTAATYYEDKDRNLCVGVGGFTEGFPTGSGCETWGALTGTGNVGAGERVMEFNTGSYNVGIGVDALHESTTGSENTASGAAASFSDTTGNENTADGEAALGANTTGSGNVALGNFALKELPGGSNNVAIGNKAGSAMTTTKSNNIDISSLGGATDEGTTRIGTEGTQTKAFVAGVYKKAVTTPACAVKVNSEGQLGCNPEENSTAIATFATRGTKTVASGNCLNYTDIGAAGTGSCPGPTTGFSSSTRLAGPTPANGATVTNLYADSNAAVSGTDTVLVAVIDNTTGATLLSCTVDSTNKSSCSNSSGSGSAAAGDNVEVKLTATGASGDKKLWRVTFRF